MIIRQVTQDMIESANSRSSKMGELNNSITRGQGNIAGFVGEEIVMDFAREFYPYDIRLDDSYDYDLMWGRWRIDVKTKRTAVAPLDSYEASIAAFNTKQQCDAYVFVRVMNDYSCGYICGWEAKRTYFEKARFLRAGEYDNSNRWTCRADCYNVQYGNLRRWRIE